MYKYESAVKWIVIFFPIIILGLIIIAGIVASLILSILTLKEDNFEKTKITNNRWVFIIKVIYWSGFALNLPISIILLFFLVPSSTLMHLLAAIILPWIFGTILLAISFSKLKVSFFKKYKIFSILALYISYWPLLLWSWISWISLRDL